MSETLLALGNRKFLYVYTDYSDTYLSVFPLISKLTYSIDIYTLFSNRKSYLQGNK